MKHLKYIMQKDKCVITNIPSWIEIIRIINVENVEEKIKVKEKSFLMFRNNSNRLNAETSEAYNEKRTKNMKKAKVFSHLFK